MKDSASNYGSVLTLINLLATVVGIFFVDKIGRRKLIIIGLIISLIFMILTMLCINSASYKLALVFILVTTFGGAVGPAVCIWLVLSEVLPSSLRAIGISVALVSKALLESIFISSFLGLVANYGYTPIFGIMALCMLTFIIFVYKFLPEMANKELL